MTEAERKELEEALSYYVEAQLLVSNVNDVVEVAKQEGHCSSCKAGYLSAVERFQNRYNLVKYALQSMDYDVESRSDYELLNGRLHGRD